MKFLVLVIVIAAGVFFSPASVHAVDNNVDVAVCGNTSEGSNITITQPLNDSVVNQPTTTFRGSVHNATQIEIEVDGEYVSTISIGSDESTFSTEVTLTKGTHTVKFIANDVCQYSNGSDSVVVTFIPETDTSQGGQTPTDVGGGVSIGTDTSDQDEPAGPFQLEQLPVIGQIYKGIVGLGVMVGLDATFEAGAGSVVVGGMRVVFTITALTLLIIPSFFFPLATNYMPPKISALVKAEMLRERHYLDRIFRGIGGLLLLLIYFS